MCDRFLEWAQWAILYGKILSPLPNINKVFSLLIQQERKIGVLGDDSKVFAYSSSSALNEKPTYNSEVDAQNREQQKNFKISGVHN